VAQAAWWRGPPPGRARWPPGPPGDRLRLPFGVLLSFRCRNFCYIFSQIIPALYLAIPCVFFSICCCQENFQQNLGALTSPSSPKDKFLINVINPHLTEVRRHPQALWVEDGVLHKEDLKGPVKEGSTKVRLEEVE